MSIINKYSIPFLSLGQSGCRLKFPGATVYFDPYLSNSAQVLVSSIFERQCSIVLSPDKVTDADFVLISHDHIDHCDPYTLPCIAQASPHARFIGPADVVKKLIAWGIESSRISLAVEEWIDLTPDLRVCAIPSAHPDIIRDSNGNLNCIGYLIDIANQLIYFAGDTCSNKEIIDNLVAHGTVHTAILPVNEHNYFRERSGIIGNMSVREAYQFAVEIGARQVVPVHWDMFHCNSVEIDEMSLLYQSMNPGFKLLIRPSYLNLRNVKCSIVIRTLNEEMYLSNLLHVIAKQNNTELNHEIVIVDSGSTDNTLKIAESYGCRIEHITREEFSFGRSLNIGCMVAQGDILVFISGHCIPTDEYWLQHLCQPILDAMVEFVYGRQVGGSDSFFSECRIFSKYYPEYSSIPQVGYFCNNANSAILRSVWEQYRFDEELTGLEDMHLAQRIVNSGYRIGYVADACIIHHHKEIWSQVRRRFEREAIALKQISPHIHVTFFDTVRYLTASVWKDWSASPKNSDLINILSNIIMYRWNQYVGSWTGSHQSHKLSHVEKEKYFYPH